MWRVLVCLGLALAVASAKDANIVYREPQLSLHFADVIHPYAWAHARPDPYYDASATAYSMGKSAVLSAFLEIQTHIKSKSPQAAVLMEVASANEPEFQVDPKGFSTVMGLKPDLNPAAVKMPPADRIESDFKKMPSYKESTGSYPGAYHFRRAQYGVRRRRLPYFSHSEGFGSVNPYRKLNSFFHSPQDMLAPKAKWAAAKDPSVFDLGRFAHLENKLPYGGYSSFHSARFRSARDAAALPPVANFPAVPPFPRFPSSFKGTGAGRFSDGSPMHTAFSQGIAHPHFGRPVFNTPSPYIPGMTGEFFNFFGNGGGEGSESGSG